MSAVRKHEQVYDSHLPMKNKKVIRSAAVEKNKALKTKNRVRIIATMAVGMAVVLLLLYRTAEISKMKYDLSDLEQNITEASRQREELNIALGEIKNSEWLVTEAQSKINLRKATKDQIVKLDISDANSLSLRESGLKSTVVNFLGNLSKK